MSESKGNLIKKLALEVSAEQQSVIELKEKIASLEEHNQYMTDKYVRAACDLADNETKIASLEDRCFTAEGQLEIAAKNTEYDNWKCTQFQSKYDALLSDAQELRGVVASFLSCSIVSETRNRAGIVIATFDKKYGDK